MPICTVLTGSEWRDRPRPLDSRRPVPPAFEEVDLGRRPGREDPRPEGRAVQCDAGIQEDLAAAGLPARGPPGGPVHRGAAHAGTGTDRRRAGPDGAHHQARQGEPGPRSARARRDSRRRPVRTGAGWSTSPTCRPGTGFLVAPPSSRGLCATAASSAGPPARARGAGARPAPWNRRPGARKHRDGGQPPEAWCTTATTDPSHLSIAYTGRLVDEGTGRLGRSLGLLPAQAPPPRPWASPLQARGPFWRDGPRGTATTPRGRNRPLGEPVPTTPDPTRPTTTAPHPPPPNTATIATTPPPRPPQHNQPPTKPRTIHQPLGLTHLGLRRFADGVPELCDGAVF